VPEAETTWLAQMQTKMLRQGCIIPQQT